MIHNEETVWKILFNILVRELTATRTDFASTDKYRGYWGCSLHMDQNNASSSQPLNGDLPTNISYNRMPKDHQSTLWLYFWPLIIYTDDKSIRRNWYNLIYFSLNHSYLWRHIIGCTTKCIRCFVQVYLEFAHSKVGDSHVPVEV